MRNSFLKWLMLIILQICSSVSAQPTEYGFTSINSAAISLQLDSIGNAYGLDREGQAWRKPSTVGSNWQRLPGRFRQLRVGMDDSVWGLTSDAVLLKLVSQTWWQKFSENIADVAAGPDGAIAVLNLQGDIFLLDFQGKGTAKLPLLEKTITHIRADEHGLLWAWSNTESTPYLRRFDGAKWLTISVPSTVAIANLAVGPQGTVMALTINGAVYRWDQALLQWFLLDQTNDVADVAIGPNDKPWFLSRSGRILASDLFIKNDVLSTETKPSLFTRLLKWKRVRGAVNDISVSTLGDVWTVDTDSNVWQWKGKDNWTLMPGRMRKVAASSQGTLGIDLEGRVMRFAGGYWIAQGLSSATHIAAAENGDAFALADNGKLFVLKATTKQWTFAGGPVAIYLAVGKSLPWLVDVRGRVWTWRENAWTELPLTNAQTLGVGADGGVYITTPEQNIMWLDKRENVWKAATGKASKIAVGIKDAPWIVGERNETFGSTLFFQENDKAIEARDAQTQAPPKPVFTVSPPAASFLPPSTKPITLTAYAGAYLDVGAGNDGSVFSVGLDGGLYCLNKNEQRFTVIGGLTGRKVAVDHNGLPWLINQSYDLQHFVKGVWVAVPDFKALDVTVSSDNNVYAVEKNQQIVFKIFNDLPTAVLTSENLPLRAKRIAVLGAQIWFISATDRVGMCTPQKCNFYNQTAQDIASSADGTVMVIDSAGALLRYDPKQDGFANYGTNASAPSVAVSLALQGIPWVVSRGGIISGPSQSTRSNAAAANAAAANCIDKFKGQIPATQPVTAQLIARADVASLVPGGILNLLSNDSLNGLVPSSSSVLIRIQTPSPYLSVVPNGVQVNLQTPLGLTLTATYAICAQPSGAPCASAPLSITTIPAPQNNGPQLFAQPDNFSTYQGITTTLNVLANDSLNGVQINPNQVNLTINAGSSPLLSAAAGRIVVDTNNAFIGQSLNGSYSVCLRAPGTLCAQAPITINVTNPVQASPVTYTTAGRFCLACNASYLGQPLRASGNGPPLPFYGFTSGGDYQNQSSGFIGVNASVGFIDYDGNVQLFASAPAPAVYTKNYTVCVTRDLFATCATSTATNVITIDLPAPVITVNNWSLNVQANQSYAINSYGVYNGQNIQESNTTWSMTRNQGGNFFVFNDQLDRFNNFDFNLISIPANTQPGGSMNGTFRVCNKLAPAQCATSSWSMLVVP